MEDIFFVDNMVIYIKIEIPTNFCYDSIISGGQEFQGQNDNHLYIVIYLIVTVILMIYSNLLNDNHLYTVISLIVTFILNDIF